MTDRDDDDQVLEIDLDDLEHRTLDDIRALRAACIEIETGLSYLRRMVQAPLDITRREQARRRSGEDADLHTVVEELPQVLADNTRAGGVGRLSQTLEPTMLDPELRAELDALVGDGRIAAVTDMSDDELEALVERLASFERRISERRKAAFERIDALQAELTRRYRTGEASVDSLLD